jgi:hypothetical protein
MAKDNSKHKWSLSKLVYSYRARREERKQAEAASNTAAADRQWDMLRITGGTARPKRYFVPESDYLPKGVGSGRKPNASP